MFGIFWGILSYLTPEKNDPFVAPLRILLLLIGGMVSVFGSELIGYSGAGPLACVTMAFFSLVAWSRLGWQIGENPASTTYKIFWMIFEPILFGLTGASIKFEQLDGSVVSISVGIVLAGVFMRIVSTIVLSIGSELNLKEKIFVSIAWMSKATVQVLL